MNRKIKVSILGAGKWGANLVRNVGLNKKIDFAGVCDLDPEVRKRVGEHYPQVQLFDQFDEMLRKTKPDAVVIATPAGMHHQHVLKALEAGCHVLVEKPLATSAEEARELVQMAEKNSLILMVGHIFLYNNIVHEVKRRMDEGELGEIYYLYAQRLNLGFVRQDVDAMWNLAPHDISVINYLYSSTPHQVSAQGLCFIQKEKKLSDVNFCKLDFKDGRSAHLHISWIDPQKVRQMVVVGSEKMLVYDDANSDRHIQIYDKSVRKQYAEEISDFADFTMRVRAGDLVVPNVKLVEPLSVEINHFVDCIQSGSTPRTDGRNGLEVVCILEALSRSLASGGAATEVKYL